MAGIQPLKPSPTASHDAHYQESWIKEKQDGNPGTLTWYAGGSSGGLAHAQKGHPCLVLIYRDIINPITR